MDPRATPFPIPPTTAGILARKAVAHGVAAGLDTAPLIRRAGLSPDQLDNPQARIGAKNQVLLLALIAEALGDELLGLHLAAEFELREAGLLYFVLAPSETLADAIARAERYSRLANDGIVLRRLCHGQCGVRYAYVGIPRHSDRHQIEFWATAFVRIAAQMTGTRMCPVRVAFAHAPCARPDRAEAIVGCAITYGADCDEVAFAPTAAALPLIGADLYLNSLLVGYCEDALAHRARPTESLRTRVENAITPLLPHGKARSQEVARALGMSQRSFSRHLAAEGLTFIDVLDDLRQDLARHYLRDRRFSISEIAWLLGFQEVSAFTHAFKRWTGQTPSSVRRLEHCRAEV